LKLRIIILNIAIFFQAYNGYAVYNKLGDFNSGGWVVSVFVRGDYAYTVRHDGLVEIINVSDPEQPQLTGSLQLTEIVQGIAGKIIVSDSLAFILGQYKIHIVNISDPSAPVYTAIWDYYQGQDIIISGQLAYLTGSNYFKTLDISEIQNPVLLHTINIGFDGICLNGSLIYGIHAHTPGNLYIIDVSDPQSPVIISNFLELEAASNCDIGYNDSHVFVVCTRSMSSVDVSDPANPVVIDTLLTDDTTNKIWITNNMAFVNNGESGFKVIDISDPVHLKAIGYYDTPGFCDQAVEENDLVYSVDRNSGLQIIDISDPVNPWQIGSLDVNSQAQGIDFKDDYIYMNVGGGLEVVDISDVTDPIFNGYYFSGYGTSDNVSVRNNHLCFTQRWEWPRLNFVDISIPGEPVLLHSIDLLGGWSYYMGLIPVDQNDSHVFVGTEDSLRIYDISDFGNPVQVSAYYTTAPIMDVVVDNDRAYISTGENGIQIIDLENIYSPELLGYYNTSGSAGELTLHSGTLIIANGTGGVQFVDVSNPANPSLIDSIKPHPNSDIFANPVIVGNEMIIVDREWNELFNYDISDLSNVTLLNSLKINAEIYRLIYYSDVFFCTVNWFGMIVLDLSLLLSVDEKEVNPNVSGELKIFPNPFNSTTTIEYKLSNRSFVNVEILNQAGMKIKTLANGIEDAGIHNLSWDGTGSNQEKVPSGCYFVKINGNQNNSRQVLFIK
jgi:hypothetical protein